MPIHDWTRVEAEIFHHFHQAWTVEISNALNKDNLPDGFFALVEQVIGGPIPDVVTLQRTDSLPRDSKRSGGVAVAELPPRASYVVSAESDIYASKANRIVIKHRLGTLVAVIEIVSPGNNNTQHGFRSFVDKAAELIRHGISLLVVDLFPPGRFDPQGIHNAIWSAIGPELYEPPADKPLTVAAYKAQELMTAYVEPVGVGDSLPSLSIFLDARMYVPAPLEATYQETWDKCPSVVKELVA
ncbi:MAG TPA: DUF4058 family protein [Pirellulaceae bacterium]|nr:DUF4058 family protein [Pirellulaceae bacterium]